MELEACARGAVGPGETAAGAWPLAWGCAVPGLRAGPGETPLRRSHRPGSQPQHLPPVTGREDPGKQTGLPSICSRYSMEQLSTTSSTSRWPAGWGGSGRQGRVGGEGCRDRLSLPVGARPLSSRSHRQLSPPPTPQGHWPRAWATPGCPRDTGQTWERAQRAGIWGKGIALAHLSPRGPRLA